ncbi:hypothetical protein EC973_002012 [Apophysomyces ossiformis]|uniref:Uncharacterized protein n=1 Tax=Apophysomyces ossiformis TaxID=679940 RepID=A0A8H7BL99_9FUNG|nr:hypothetical protein EC973_002012 [Apophysomyces ossiformis]
MLRGSLLSKRFIGSTSAISRTKRYRLDQEYMPWSNEYSGSGTTREIMEHKVACDDCVDPMLELEEARSECEVQDGPDFLLWSAANREISEISEEISHTNLRDSVHIASFGRYQPARPIRQVGLFKPLKKPAFKRLN